MMLKKNPFYLLNALMTDDRQKIVSKAEEQSFFDESAEISDAQSILLNPAKRLDAEIDWFPGVTTTKRDQEIKDNIKNNEAINTMGLNPLDELNALINNLVISGKRITEKDIETIDRGFNRLRSEQILSDINEKRSIARISETSLADVESALLRKRDSIRNTISEKFEQFDDAAYVSIINSIAEKYIDNEGYEQGIVMDDTINQYEVRMQSVIEEKTEEVLQLAQNVEKATNEPERTRQTKLLIEKLEEWDKYAQPLQLKARAEGQMHSISENLARVVRNTSITIHNEKDDIRNSTKIFEALKKVFCELPEFMTIILEDTEVLEKNKQARKQVEEVEKAYRRRQIVNWIIRLIVIGLVITGITMCHNSNSSDDSSDDDSSTYTEDYDDSYDDEGEDYDDYDDDEDYEDYDEPQYEEKKMPKNAHVFIDRFSYKPSRLEITNDGDYAYYMKIVNGNGKTMKSFFIRPNRKVNAHIGTGTYYIKYAFGTTWYGKKHLFGEETVYKKFDDSFTFTKEQYWTLTLQAVVGGNASSEEIDPDDF